MKKSMIATAVMMAISGTAFAAAPEWVEATQDLKNNVVTVTPGSEKTEINSDAYVESRDPNRGTVYVTSSSTDATNKNSIWGKVSDNGRLALVHVNNNFINDGNLYISGEIQKKIVKDDYNPDDDGKWYGSAAVKISGQGSFTNENLIYAKNAVGIMVNSGSNAIITNNKTIVAYGDGNNDDSRSAIGIDASANAQTTITNTDTIYALGKSYGVRLVEGTGDNGEPTIFTNSGKIYAEDGSYAIYANNSATGSDEAIIVNLENGSHIEGLVGMDENSVLNIKEVSGETIALETIRGKAGGDGMTVNLTSSNVTIEQGTEKGLTIGTLTVGEGSSANFLLNKLADEGEKVLTVKNVEDNSGKGIINVTYSGAVSDELAKDPSQKSNLFEGLSLENGQPSEVAVLEGKSGDSATYVLGDSGQVVATNVRVNSLLASTQDVAINSALMWRTQLSSYTDRMSALRTNPQSAGIWARYINGRLDGEGITHDYNTVEIGYDHKVSDLITLGASVSYTIGDADLRAGQADNDTYTAGLYATLNQNNFFVDAMVKVGYIDSDYDISNQSWSEHGDYDMFGAIFGIETGYRFNVNSFFFEPQARLTFSKLSPESYNTNLRSVNFDDIESFVGSLGFISGFNFNEKGSVYAGASYNYDFMGSVNSEITTDNAVRYFKSELDDSWGEAKIGASYMFMDNLNAFMDVSRDIGADIEQQWRVNLGARYMF